MSKDWWDYYVPMADEDRLEMVCVCDDPAVLQNKMRLANMRICEKCSKRDKSVEIARNGRRLNCPIRELDLIEDKSLPKKCYYMMEHMIAHQRLKEEKKNETDNRVGSK